MKKIYVLDTNIYLTDPDAIYRYGTNDIAIPLKVLEEVDRHKKRSDNVGANARKFARMLDAYRAKGSLYKGVRIAKRKGLIYIKGYTVSVLPKEFSIKVPDNEILAVALTLRESTDRRVIMVSRDINMRVKCDALNLPSEDYDADQVLARRDRLYGGYTEVLVDDQIIDRFYHEKDTILLKDIDKKHASKHPNQFVMLISSSNEKKTALARYKGPNIPLATVGAHKKGLWGIKAKNKEQSFALDLLLDPSVLVVTLVGKAGTGKAQPLDADVLTPRGYVKMGSLKVGDAVVTPDGKSAPIVGVFPQGVKEIYRVMFSDGVSTECCKEHLWVTQTSLERDQKLDGEVRTTHEIAETLTYGIANKKNHSIKMTAPVDFKQKRPLPLDPYFVGVLLGDGGLSSNRVEFSTADKSILLECDQVVKRHKCKTTKLSRDKYSYRVIKEGSRNSHPNPIKEILNKLEMLGKRSFEKSIPWCYKHASVDNRINLLKGLMDTDGTINKNHTTFTSTSKRLAEDVKFIVESLGGKAIMKSRITTYTHNGIKRNGRRSYRVNISLNINPFKLKRKASQWNPKTKYPPTRYITDVKYVGSKEAQCILIDHPEHLYITNNFIVTHNTLLALAAGLEQTIGHKGEGRYRRMVVSRPIQPVGKDLGYLPGNLEEKMSPWIAPIQDNLQYMLGDDHGELERYIETGIIEIEALTYIRGRSIPNAYIIIDESQNLTRHELKTMITRVGEGTKIILTGDIDQIDNAYVNEVTNGLTNAVEKFKPFDFSGHVTLYKGERSRVASEAARIL